MQGGGKNRKVPGKDQVLAGLQGGGMVTGTGRDIYPGASYGQRQQKMDRALGGFQMASGRRMAAQDMRQDIKDMYEDEMRLARLAEGGLRMISEGGATYLGLKKMKEIADAKKLQEMMTPDDPEQQKADIADVDAALTGIEDARRYGEAPGANPYYDALPEEGKIAFQALAKQRDQALEAQPPPPPQVLTREEQIENLRAMEPVADPVSAPSVDEPEPTPIRKLSAALQFGTPEEKASLNSLLERMIDPNAAYSATREGLMNTFLQQRRAKALAEAEAQIAAAIENNDVFAFNAATKAKNDILRGDF